MAMETYHSQQREPSLIRTAHSTCRSERNQIEARASDKPHQTIVEIMFRHLLKLFGLYIASILAPPHKKVEREAQIAKREKARQGIAVGDALLDTKHHRRYQTRKIRTHEHGILPQKHKGPHSKPPSQRRPVCRSALHLGRCLHCYSIEVDGSHKFL
jgi:hypothetical protein